MQHLLLLLLISVYFNKNKKHYAHTIYIHCQQSLKRVLVITFWHHTLCEQSLHTRATCNGVDFIWSALDKRKFVIRLCVWFTGAHLSRPSMWMEFKRGFVMSCEYYIYIFRIVYAWFSLFIHTCICTLLFSENLFYK